MLTNCSLLRFVHSLSTALLGTLALLALFTCSASASVTPDQAFGKGGVVKLQLESPLDSYDWDDGTALRDGSIAFVASRSFSPQFHRPPEIRIIRSDGRIDRNLGSKYLIPFPGWTRSYRLYRNAPSVLARQADGKLLLAGNALIPRRVASKRCGCAMYRPGWYVMRLLKSGERDHSFGRGGVAIVSEGGEARKRSQILASGPSSLEIDRRGGILLHGPEQDKGSGARLVRLKENGGSDRQFQTIVGSDDSQMGLTGSGEIVTVRVATWDPGVSGFLGIAAEIRRYSPTGKVRGRRTVRLPGLQDFRACNGKCGSGLPAIRAKVLPTGAVLIIGGGTESGLTNPSGTLTMVDANDNLIESFGSGGHLVLPKPYITSVDMPSISARPNGEIWAVVMGWFEKVTETRLLRLTPSGEIIRPADGAIGMSLPGLGNQYGGSRLAIVGAGVLQSASSADANSTIRPLVVRRWNLKF